MQFYYYKSMSLQPGLVGERHVVNTFAQFVTFSKVIKPNVYANYIVRCEIGNAVFPGLQYLNSRLDWMMNWTLNWTMDSQ